VSLVGSSSTATGRTGASQAAPAPERPAAGDRTTHRPRPREPRSPNNIFVAARRDLSLMSDLVRRLTSDSPQRRAAVAAAGAALGALLLRAFVYTPQYDRVPDPRLVPVNGLHWLVLGIVALAAAGYLIHTLAGDVETAPDERGDPSPVDALRRRYATGELSEAEFERRLERLLETEDAAGQPGTPTGDGTDPPDPDSGPASPSKLTEG